MAVIYLCPVDKRLLCSWEGYASDIKQHFEKEHNGLLFQTNSIEIDLNTLSENRLMDFEGEIYLIQSYVGNNKLYLKMRYLGSSVTASRMQYDIIITVDNVYYKHDIESYVKPTREGWEVNVEELERVYGKLQSLTCTILIENKFEDNDFEIRRKVSDISLRINNSFIEKNVCDETEAKYLEGLLEAEKRLQELKDQKDAAEIVEKLQQEVINLADGIEQELKNQNDNDDFMDKISQLNFSILEEPFRHSIEERKSDNFTEILPEIPEELNLTCSSCTLDMLPPIYLCNNGHSVCSWCRGSPCKKCDEVITTTRNTDLENVSRTHKHNCRYSSDGCNEKLLYNEVRSHEAKCPFCKYKCCSTACPYEGKFQPFINHLKIIHSSIKISHMIRNEFVKNTEFYIAHNSIGIFYCKSEQRSDAIIWTATFCGPKERQFFCELTFKGSKFREPIFLKRRGNVFEVIKTLNEMKKMKAKDKYALLSITSYDS